MAEPRIDVAGAVKRALMGAASLLLLSCAPARAAGRSFVNIAVDPQGIAAITNLSAQTSGLGSISLTWTEPGRNAIVLPASYDVRVSTVGQIPDNPAFLASQALSVFSPSPVPAPGSGGGQAGFVVTGLAMDAVYCFAIREKDSASAAGAWLRDASKSWSLNNCAGFALPPEAVTDLAAAPGPSQGQVTLSWTSPVDPSTSPVTSYTVHFASFSAASFGGDADAWFAATVSSSAVLAAGQPPGGRESRALSLDQGVAYYFAIKSANANGASLVDSTAFSSQAAARAKGLSAITDLAAASGAVSGSVSLTWTEPYVSSTTAPRFYQVAVSTVGHIADDAAFAAAAALSAFSPSSPPAPGAGGARGSMTVTGLIPGVTYYLAIRESDSSVPAMAGRWRRDVPSGLNVVDAAAASFIPGSPDPITDLAAAPGTGAEGDLVLSWTAPRNQNLVPIASYVVRFTSFSVASLGGDTTAWFNLAASSSVTVSPAKAPGAAEVLTLSGLYPLTTFYFAVKSIDVFGETSPIDVRAQGPQASSRPLDLPPAVPAGLAGTAGLRKATLSWTALTPAQKGLDFGFYRLYRSTLPATNFVSVATTTATSYVDFPLLVPNTYYYRLSASDLPGGPESALTSAVSVVPFTLAPQAPFGLGTSFSSATVTLSWSPTLGFSDGTPFSSTSPAIDELEGYQILRSTNICSASFSALATVPASSTSYTDSTAGSSYFYQIRSFNTVSVSSGSPTLSVFGDQHYFTDDCVSELVLTATQGAVLTKAGSGLGGDVLIAPSRRPQDVGSQVFQSIEFKPLLNGVSELKTFHLPSPARIVAHFGVSSGQPVPSGLGVENLGMYWYNGVEFKKMYGKVDGVDQTVSVNSPNLGIYQVRALLRSGGAVFDVSNVSSKVITPNDDGLNDLLIFAYDPGPNNVQPDGAVYDLRGAKIGDMRPGLVPHTLVWDGKSDGRAVSGGVYVYQIKGDGKVFNGTVVVAR